MNNIEEILGGVSTMGIAGHVRPDGDAIGTCVALYLYIKKYHEEIQVDLYLDHPPKVFDYLPGIKDARTEEENAGFVYDLFVTCDVAAPDRLVVGANGYDRARRTVCIDHHCSNGGFAQVNHVRGSIGSCSEVLYNLMDPDMVDKEIATALYTGLIHDTGVFQYSNTTPDTLRIAARLLETGVDFSNIIEKSFYQKTYVQNQVMGRVLTESLLIMDGRVIIGYMRSKDMDFYGVGSQDMDGIVNQLRNTAGIYVAIFLYEVQSQVFKVSMRSTGEVDVSEIAIYFGGGGHFRAAGCELPGSMYDVINNLTERIQVQLQEKGLI